MFCFCCPKKNKNKLSNSIDQKLIQVNDSSPRRTIPSSKRLAMSESDKKKPSLSDLTQKSLPLSHAQTSNNHHANMRHPHFLSDGHNMNIGIQPYFQQQSLYNSKHIPSPLTKNKGQIYDLDHNTQIIYFDTKKQDEFCLRYLINKKPNIQRQAKSILNYVLSRKSHQHLQDTQLVLVIPSKVLYETKHLQIPQHVHAIFTNMRRLQKNPSVNNSTQIIQIVEGDYGFIKTQAFDKIIVILQGQQDPQYIKHFCTQLCKRYSLQQFIKIWWILPAHIGIEDISDIIKQTLRKFLITERIQHVAKYMFYQIDLIKQLNLQPFLLVKNKRWRQSATNNNLGNKNKSNAIKKSTSASSSSAGLMTTTQKTLMTKDYETQICLAMGLLMVEMNQNVMPFYKYFLQNVLGEMKLIDYMKYRSLLQNQKQNFFRKLVFYNLLSQQGCKILQENNKIIQHKYQNIEHRRFSIKHSVKKKFIAAFGFQDSVQTGQNNTPVQQQWDDELRLQDLQTRKGSWDKQSGGSDDNDLNLIDQQEIQNIVIEQLMFGDEQNNNKTQHVQQGNNNNENQQQQSRSITKNDKRQTKKQHKDVVEDGQMQIEIIQTKQVSSL